MEHSYESADALVRAVRSATAEPLVEFVGSLIKQQYALSYVCQLAQHALAFERWCEDRRISFHALRDDDIARANTIIEADNFLTRWGGDK